MTHEERLTDRFAVFLLLFLLTVIVGKRSGQETTHAESWLTSLDHLSVGSLLITLDLHPGRKAVREYTIVKVATGDCTAIPSLLLLLEASVPEE